MTNLTKSLLLSSLVLGGCFATVDGQGRATGQAVFTIGLPAVLPPLIVVQPGISVVGDLDEEVFFADGYYWARRDGAWIRTRDHRSGWTRVEPRYVPGPIVRAPPGRYRHYRGEGRQHEEHGNRGREEHDRH